MKIKVLRFCHGLKQCDKEEIRIEMNTILVDFIQSKVQVNNIK